MEETIGDRVRRLRKAKGWTQVVLAVEADRAPSVVSQVETGKRDPELSTIKSLAEALGVDWRYLLLGDQLPKAPAPLPLDRLVGEVGGATDPTRAAKVIQGTGDLAVDLAAVWNQDVALYEQHGRTVTPARLYEMQAALIVLHHQFWGGVEVLQRHAKSIGADPDVMTWTPRAKQGLLEALTSICALAELYEVIRRSAAQSGADRDDLRAMREEYDVGAPAFFTEDPQWPEAIERARAAVGLS